MAEGRYVQIKALSVLEGRILRCELSYSRDIRRYFVDDVIEVEYERDIGGVDRSILQIPAIANIATFAWAVGADIYADELDGAFLSSLERIRRIMGVWYSRLPFSTEMKVGRIVQNRFPKGGYGLLFSGGLDSTASYLRHRERRPELFTIWGADIPLVVPDFWSKVRRLISEFARREGVRANFIRANIREFLDEMMLAAKFGRYGRSHTWWEDFQHGMGSLGLCAPLTAASGGVGTLLIASTTFGTRQPWGSDPLIDENVAWADVNVIHDGFEMSRQEKIGRVLKGHIAREGRYPILRVCNSQYREINCSRCPKCKRTIMGLALEGIDPNKCGFSADGKFFDSLRAELAGDGLAASRIQFSAREWADFQGRIPAQMDHDVLNSKGFFEWLRGFDFSKSKGEPMMRQLAASAIYGVLPERARRVVHEAHRDSIERGRTRAPFSIKYTAKYVLNRRLRAGTKAAL